MSNNILNTSEELEVAKGQIRQQQAQIQLLTKFLGYAIGVHDLMFGDLLIEEQELEKARTVSAEFDPKHNEWTLRVVKPVDPSLVQ